MKDQLTCYVSYYGQLSGADEFIVLGWREAKLAAVKRSRENGEFAQYHVSGCDAAGEEVKASPYLWLKAGLSIHPDEVPTAVADKVLTMFVG